MSCGMIALMYLGGSWGGLVGLPVVGLPPPLVVVGLPLVAPGVVVPALW